MLEQQAAAVGTNLMGSDHTYVIPPAAAPGATPAPRVAPGQKRCAALRMHAPAKAGCQRMASVLCFSLLCCDGGKAAVGLWAQLFRPMLEFKSQG